MSRPRERASASGTRRLPPRPVRALRAATAALLLLAAPAALALGLERIAEIVPVGAEAGVLAPAGLWYDEQRDVLVLACPNAQRVLVVDRQGVVQGELGKAGELRFPRSVAASRDGTLYVVSPESESITVFDRYAATPAGEGRSVSLAPHRGGAPVRPTAVFVDERGSVYVADRANRQILVLRRDGKLERTLAGVGEPADVWADRAGTIYVAEPGLGGVRVHDAQGTLVRTLGSFGSQFPEPIRPRALALDRSGRVWILEEGSRGIKALDGAGNLLFSMKGDGLRAPADLAVDGRGNLYVIEEGGNRVSVFRISGT